MDERTPIFWSIPTVELLDFLGTSENGLTDAEASLRLIKQGKNVISAPRYSGDLRIFVSQFKSPIILILVFAVFLSFFLRDATDALIILSIVLVSGLLGFWQERRAAKAIDKLLAIVQTKTTVLRNGRQEEIANSEIVPGDIVILSAGANIPADCFILESKDLFINEATLTGETYPVEKTGGILPPQTPLAQRKNSLFMGTYVVSGTTNALVIRTGKETEFGRVSERLMVKPPETEFEHGLRRFGYFLMEVTLLLVIAIFAVNVYLARPVLDAFLFSLALAVGLTPQLLPAIVSVNLAHGARRMAQKKVVVKRLASIENFGSMNVLCSDKTGTLTEGLVTLDSFMDADGNKNEKILLYSYLNSFFEKGFTNPMDEAIRKFKQFPIESFQKLDEVPYDFIRKRLSVLVSSEDKKNIIITKGSLVNVLDVCTKAELVDGSKVDIQSLKERILKRFEELSNKGFRVLAIAYRNLSDKSRIDRQDETDMTLLGLLTFFDPIKQVLAETIERLRRLGISLKVITGDNRHVATYIGQQIGLQKPNILTGSDLRKISDDAIFKQVNQTDIFAEVEPNQKERIILALRKSGNITGFMGDGINDASALHAADVGISVDGAVDVAKEAADIVLLEKDLSVLLEGVQEGRATFANTLKYVFMATSANFGNMFSMAGASLFLPFLPLLPKQILLVNLLTDLPEMAIATDSIDSELIDKPHKWDIKFIRRFMVTFGLLSSFFDMLTFAAFLLLLHASREQLRTGWFLESIVSAATVVMIIRTRRPFFRSKPGKYLLIATLITIIVSVFVPFSPLAKLFNFVPLPTSYLVLIVMIIFLYAVMAEFVKRWFYKKVTL
jgi:Mg2+-importing ATPase